MDPAAFATLVERCASPDMAAPLTTIVQQASSFEPFLITLGERKPIRLQATDRNEAIQLATEAAATGKPVRIGLGQLNREEMKLAGLTITTTFDACQHVAGLSRLFQVRSQTAIASGGISQKAALDAVESLAVKDKLTIPGGDLVTRPRNLLPTNLLQTEPPVPISPGSAQAGTSIARASARQRLSMGDEEDLFAQSPTKPAIRAGSAATLIGSLHMPSRLKQSAALVCIGLVLSVGLAEPALAQTANIEGVLQNIVTMLTGNVARLLATLAVIIVGIAWMFGYLDLRKAAYVVLGVAITFGASEVVSTLTGGR